MMDTFRPDRVFFFGLFAFFCLPFSDQSFSDEQPEAPEISAAVPDQIQILMQDRDYRAAITAIDKAVDEGRGPVDYLIYLKGRAFHHQKKYDDAARTFDALVEKHADSSWARRAKFAKGAALARKGDYRAAELIYRAQAELLLSTERKEQLASICLDFADAWFQPADQLSKPDYDRARLFYEKALEIGLERIRRIEVELLVGRCFEQAGQWDEAVKRYAALVKKTKETELNIGALTIDAAYRLGWCRLKQGQLAQTRRTWQDLLAAHPDDSTLNDASRERLAEASYHMAETYGAPSPPSDEDLDLALASLDRFLEMHPVHQLAGTAHLRAIESLVSRGRFESATERITVYLGDTRYKDRKETPRARFLLGVCFARQKAFDKAIAAWRDYLVRHPAHEDWSQAQKAIIDTQFAAASEAVRKKEYAAARNLWTEFLTKYPLDRRAPKILFAFGQMEYDQRQWERALADWRRVVSKYPKTNESSQAQYQIGLLLETKLGKLDEAITEYKKVSWGGHLPAAKQRIAQLVRKEMKISTDRVFRTDETPKLSLTTRNIESVEVKIYTVDLETYFRKMHLARGVEGLDIALIDPDKTFEFQVPEYVKMKSIDSRIEVPLPDVDNDKNGTGGGVVAVTVSSKTLEATTLAVRSDLEIIVKSSRDEVFVFAQNMRTGKAWPGARLLISNGSKVFAEAATGDDGVLRKSFNELKQAGDVRVFAIAEGSVASNVIDLSGVGVSQGLADKGYIYTDRPAYRAGQMVHVRGVIRLVTGDQYVVDDGKAFDVSVLDPRGRQVWSGEVVLNTFGSFHCHFPIPQTGPQGEYRIDVREEKKERGKRSYQGAFVVHETQLEPVRLTVDTPRRVYYRGETIEGTIRAEFYYGAPLAERTIRYQLPGEPVVTATTDDRGEVRFKLETGEYRETGPLPLSVQLPERNLATQQVFILATRGFLIGAKTPREVFLAGETFETTITTTDAEGKPVGRELEATLYQVTKIHGETGEKKVAARQVATTEKEGTGRVTFSAEEGGKYFLRITGRDRFQNPISATHALSISDDKDNIRLRILAERHTFKVGDDAKIRVHWREKRTLGLVTYQGAQVLGYRLIELAQGENLLDLPMTAALAPNFDLAIGVMTDVRGAGVGVGAGERGQEAGQRRKRFHEASSPFTVIREMNVTVAVKGKGPVQPGQEVEVEVTATDPQGRPLAAELSLAMIEETLLDRFPPTLAAIDDFFRGNYRKSAVRTTSSITFDYRPATCPINANLLAERERLESEVEEESALEEMSESLRADVDGTILGRAGYGVGGGLFADTANRPADSMGRDGRAALDVPDESAGERGLNSRPGRRRGDRAPGGMAANGQQMGQRSEPQSQEGEYSFSLGFIRGSDSAGPQETANRLALVQSTTQLLPGDTSGLHEVNLIPQDKMAAGAVLRDLQRSGANRKEATVAYFGLHGTWGYANLADMDEKKLDNFAEKLAETGAVLLSSRHSPETGYWNPSITTDESGKATIRLTVPDRATAWKLSARGVTAGDTLAGEGEAKLVAKKGLFGQLKLPLALVDGDEAELIATVHNDLVHEGTIRVTLKTTIGSWTNEETKTVEVREKGLSEVLFKTRIDRRAGETDGVHQDDKTVRGPGPDVEAIFELTVASGDTSDVARRAVPIRPYGMTVFNTTSGSASSDTTAWISLPEEMSIEGPSMQIVLGPNVERSLLDILLAPAPWCQREASRLVTTIESTSSDLMAAISLVQLLNATRQSGGPESRTLDTRIRAAVGSLVSAQRDDGDWSWCGGAKAPSNRYLTARIVWALSLARQAGYQVPDDPMQKGIGFLQSALAKLDNSDNESRAVLLHALTVAGKADFSQVNRLTRSRQGLSPTALCYLALTYSSMERKEMARELLGIAGKKDLSGGPADAVAWCSAPTETRALHALACQAAMPTDAAAKAEADWLLANRTGHRWAPDKATGPATMALTRHIARHRFESAEYKLTLFVNDTQAAELAMTPSAQTRTLDIPSELLTFAGGNSKQTIRFQLTGRGQYTYQIALGGFVPADKLRSTVRDWEVRRFYEPALLELDGETIPRGFGVVDGSYSSFRNPLTQLPVGVRGQVALQMWRRNIPARTPDSMLPYLVVTEPIPSGTTVIEKSIQGPFERYEIGPGAIKFYIGGRRGIGTIRYDLHGYVPGTYRAAPTVVRDAYASGRLAAAKAKSITVLPLGSKSGDKVRLTPDELFHLGKRHFAKGRMVESAEHLAKLLADWRIDPDPFKESVRMLLDANLEIGPPHEVVQYFEIIKEKWPEVEIPFDKIVKIGDAYHQMGEYERSYMVFRATVESSFLREVRVAGFLDGEGQFLKSVDVMSRLLREYPPEPYVASAQYALAQQVFAKADELEADPALRAKLREEKITRVELVRQSLGMLGAFMTACPEDPAADEAALSQASALLGLKQYQPVIAACKKYADRYPDSQFIESYWYTVGFCHFALGEHADALATCRKVAEMKRKDQKTGRMVEAENRWQAVYILGQIYHSLGQAVEAIREYTRVKDRFPDAGQAIDYFTRKEIRLPEVTALKPGVTKPVELAFRNIPSCEVRVYKIDLMKFSLLKRNLANITKINLAGIRPHHQARIELGDGKDYRDRKHSLALPLEGEGAYLVVCGGGGLYASGLVLVSPLVVDVQEDRASGRVRVTVKETVDAKEGGASEDGDSEDGAKYLAEVHVKVIGSNNGEFTSGETDLRGIFVADAIAGTSTVIARTEGGNYAFFRGKTHLGQKAENEPQSGEESQSGQKRKSTSGKELLKNVFRGQQDASRRNTDKLQILYHNESEGVQVEQAK